MKSRLNILIFAFVFLLSTAANSTPVKWEFDSATVHLIDIWSYEQDDIPFPIVESKDLVGSFIYDAETRIFSDVQVEGYLNTYTRAQLSSPREPGDFLLTFTACPDNPRQPCSEYADVFEIALVGITDGLPELGGTLAIEPTGGAGVDGFYDIRSGEFNCYTDDTCLGNDEYDHISVATGNLVGTVVPVPAAIWLFGSALAGLGWMRRKQTI